MVNNWGPPNSCMIGKNVLPLDLYFKNNKKSSVTAHNGYSSFLTIFHQNICGIKNKINELIVSILEIKPHIICLTEHHLCDTDSNSSFLPNIPNYKLAAIYSRTKLKGGGVCIYILDSFEYTYVDLHKYCKEQDLEIVAIKFKWHMTSFIIFCIYRAPSGNLDYFYEQLEIYFELCLKSEIILCGDFNIDFSDNNYKKTQLINFLSSYNLFGTVHFPTRITPTSSSIIDNICIGNQHNYTIIPYINGLSDHDGQLLTLRDLKKFNQPQKKYRYKRTINDMTISNFQFSLSLEEWREIFVDMDVNYMYNKFLNIYLKNFNLSFPYQRKYIPINPTNSWITKGIRNSCKKKKLLYLLYRSTSNLWFRSYYKKYCSILSKVILHAKKNYYIDIILKSNNKMGTYGKLLTKRKEIKIKKHHQYLLLTIAKQYLIRKGLLNFSIIILS